MAVKAPKPARSITDRNAVCRPPSGGTRPADAEVRRYRMVSRPDDRRMRRMETADTLGRGRAGYGGNRTFGLAGGYTTP